MEYVSPLFRSLSDKELMTIFDLIIPSQWQSLHVLNLRYFDFVFGVIVCAVTMWLVGNSDSRFWLCFSDFLCYVRPVICGGCLTSCPILPASTHNSSASI